MAYKINKTNGSLFATVENGTINTDSSQIIVGKNFKGYGEFMGENLIHLLESAANITPPTNALVGQLWYNTAERVLTFFNGVNFKPVSSMSSEEFQPGSPVVGDFWFDPAKEQLYAYSGTNFILIGPSFSAGDGLSGAVVDTIFDLSDSPHIVIKFYVDEDVVSIISKDATFTPDSNSGLQLLFPYVYPGYTLAKNQGYIYEGTARGSYNIVDDQNNIIEKLNKKTSDKMEGDLTITGAGNLNSNSPNLSLKPYKIGGTSSINFVSNTSAIQAKLKVPHVTGDLSLERYNTGTGALATSLVFDLTGNVSINGPAPNEPGHLTRKDYVDGKLVDGSGDIYVKRSGSTMTNYLKLHAPPIDNLHAATKLYVDNKVAANVPDLTSRVRITGDTMTGFLTLNADPTSNLHAATKIYVDNKIIGNTPDLTSRVKIAGDTMTGHLVLNADPTSNLHAATKIYVDNKSNSIPIGSVMVFYMASAPTDWNRVINSSDFMLRVAPTGGTTAGSDNPIYNAKTVAAHKHTGGTTSNGNHTHSFMGANNTSATGQFVGGQYLSNTVYHYFTATGAIKAAGAHTHSLSINNASAVAWTPRYANVVVAIRYR